HPREEIDAQLGDLEKPLGHLITQLEQQLPEEQGETKVKVDRKILKAVCDKLEALLIADDAEAVDVLDAHADLLSAALPNHYRAIHDGIRSFDFEAAL